MNAIESLGTLNVKYNEDDECYEVGTPKNGYWIATVAAELLPPSQRTPELEHGVKLKYRTSGASALKTAAGLTSVLFAGEVIHDRHVANKAVELAEDCVEIVADEAGIPSPFDD